MQSKHLILVTYVILAMGFFTSIAAIQIFYSKLSDLTDKNTYLVAQVDKQQAQLELIQDQSAKRAEENCKLIEKNTQIIKAIMNQALVIVIQKSESPGVVKEFGPLQAALDTALQPLSCDAALDHNSSRDQSTG